uniref:Eukaryotic translation initiation factor 4E-1A n=1 Tax=Phallusia mammillata TaxID=59560 RepID=A0A6F9DCD6_9ASCI|nr:eukaryotic translation initiation factor 4E-1A [Phallusia mammillata]
MSASDKKSGSVTSETKKKDLQEKDNNENKIVAKKEETPIIEPDKYMKHPLQCKWALWFFKNDRAKKWEDNLRLVTKFDTVEDFWALYNHIQLSSKLQSGCDYNLFKDGIQPMWEDDANKKGGKWMLQLNKQQRASELDKIWLETLLVLIGEGFGEDSEFVNGGVVQVRNKGDKTAIWTSDWKNKSSIVKIGEVYKQRLGLPKKMSIGFQAHEDTINKTGSTVKSIYHV